jgi:hypothetical protein
MAYCLEVFKCPLERRIDTLLRAALHFGVGGNDDD